MEFPASWSRRSCGRWSLIRTACRWRSITREPFEYYSRIRLPEIFASRLNAQDLEIYKQAWYGARHIQVYKNQDVVRIEREKHQVITRNGTAISYDELVLCTGADSFKPPIRNVDLDGVFTIREYGDADAIRKYVTAGTRHAVVVGGGLLGLETARFIEGPEIEGVTVVEIMPRLLPRQLDETGSRMLQAMLEGQKCAILTGAQVSSFLGDRKVHGVLLSDGRKLPAETVLISAGISPRISLAQEARSCRAQGGDC